MKQQQIDWVKAIMAHLGVTSANALALLAGINPANIQRPLSENYKGKFGVDTIAKIAAAAKVRPMEFPNRPSGLAEPEASQFVFDMGKDAIDSNVDRAVRELTRGRNGRDPWVIHSHALELSGILPGDVVIVDLNMQPHPKDIVCAQIYQWSTMRAETVFRVYEPPYLLTNSMRFGTSKPLLVDGNEVIIRGVVDGLFRRRAAEAA
ncbi:MAG: hypothetical protein KIS96_14590 [Bauldia sp.]|nr:hypothetical protein [Bauldia sp.]